MVNKIKNSKIVKFSLRVILLFLILVLVYSFFLAKSEFLHLTQSNSELNGLVERLDKNLTTCRDQLSQRNDSWTEIGSCSSKLVNISVSSYPKDYRCFTRTKDGSLKLSREDGFYLLFTDSWGTDYLPTNCDKKITYLSLGDANKKINFCNDQETNWVISEQIVYDKELFESSRYEKGSFLILSFNSKGLSYKEPSDKEIKELKVIIDSVTVLE